MGPRAPATQGTQNRRPSAISAERMAEPENHAKPATWREFRSNYWITLTVELVLLPRPPRGASDYLAAFLAYLPAASLLAAACRSRAAISSAWILARVFGSMAASSRS